jgi:tetratricopeptide (TPR) repeat protein
VLKNYEKAKEFFEEAMMFDVSNVNTPQYYIACLIENEDFAEAEKLITYALKIKGIEKSTLVFYRAMISERRGSLKNALKFLKEAEKNAFTSCSLEMVNERKKFVKSKLTKKRKETK